VKSSGLNEYLIRENKLKYQGRWENERNVEEEQKKEKHEEKYEKYK
jgi:hypothetical protein